MVSLTERDEGYEGLLAKKKFCSSLSGTFTRFKACAPCATFQFPVLGLLSSSKDELNRVSSRRTGQLESPLSLNCKERNECKSEVHEW